MEYVEDAPRSGQPSKVTPALEEAILTDVRKDRNGREKSSAMLAFDHELSSSTILKVLKKNGFRACKSTKKPGLTSMMKLNWELENGMRRMRLRNPGGRQLDGYGIKNMERSCEIIKREELTGIAIKRIFC